MTPYIRILWVALIALLPAAGCSSQGSDLPEMSSKPDVSAYHLGPGDRLEIKVLGADELAGQYSVQDDGTIRMLMVGDVPAAGLTPESADIPATGLSSERSVDPPPVPLVDREAVLAY